MQIYMVEFGIPENPPGRAHINYDETASGGVSNAKDE
jgi:hypothetical protein